MTEKTLSIGLNFTGSTSRDTGSTFPDTNGAVGDDHIVEFLDRRYAVYDKDTGALLFAQSAGDFWDDAGADFRFDSARTPRILYDPSIERWYATAAGLDPSNVGFAVSLTPNPLDGWAGFTFVADPLTNQNTFGYYPTMGYNDEAVFVAVFLSGVGSPNSEHSLLALPKNDLLAAVPSVANAIVFPDTVDSILQPVVDLDGTGFPHPVLRSALPFWFTGEIEIGEVAEGPDGHDFTLPVALTPVDPLRSAPDARPAFD